MKVIIFFAMFFTIFFLLTFLFRKKAFRFEEKTYSDKTASVIAERVEWERYYDKPNKKGYKSNEYLRALCHKGLEKRGVLKAHYKDRLDYELNVINKMGYDEINEKLCHRTFHDQDRVVLGAAYGGRFLNDKIKLYLNRKGKLLPLRNVYFKNTYAVAFAVVSVLIPLVIIYFFIR